MKMRHLVAGIGILSCSTIASGDVLALLAQQAEKEAAAPPTEVEAPCPWYVAAAVGGTFALDADAKENNARFRFKSGVGVNVGVGYAFAEDWAVELHSGLLWNEIDSVGGSVTSRLGTNDDLGGGTGHLYQVPVMGSIVYSLHFSDTFSLGLKAGAGIQWTDMDVENIRAFGPLAPTSTFGYSNRSTAFRWEVGVRAANQIAPNIRIGGGVMFSGTSEVNIGSPNYASGAAFLPGGDTKLDAIYNISLGFGINITF